jgi:uncharacterized protein (TIGR02588 family)
MTIEKNALEWSVFAGSLALIALVVGVLSYAQITSGERPPSLRIVAGQPIPSGDDFAVPLDVFNDGDVTAEEVEIEVVLSAGGAEERSAVVIAFVPRGSKRRAWVGFKQDPSRAKLDTRVVGYREP